MGWNGAVHVLAPRMLQWVQQPLAAGWWTAYGLIVGGSAGMLARRLGGGFDQALSSTTCIAVGACLIAVAALLRGAAPACGVGRQHSQVIPPHLAVLTFSSLLFLLTISLPDTPPVGLVISWSGVVAAEASWWTGRWHRSQSATANRCSRAPGAAEPTAGRRDAGEADVSAMRSDAGNESCSVAELAKAEFDEILPPEVSQQITRSRLEEGGEAIWGMLRVSFDAGERTKAVHLSFCPPLDSAPDFTAEPSEGPEARLEVTQVAAYGARVEVKLSEAPTTATDVVLQFEARSQRELARQTELIGKGA